MDDFTKMKNELEAVKKELDQYKKENTKLKEQVNTKAKGSNCSIEGNAYEIQVHSVVSKVKFADKLINFNTQKATDLGGSNSKNDIECNFKKEKDIPIEIKKMKTPDWMQASLKYSNNLWQSSEKGKIPKDASKIFNDLINKSKLFNGKIPPFFEKNMTYKEWTDIKEKTKDFDDYIIDIPDDTIQKLYSAKGCFYIQVSGGLGLYHLGNDICNFKVSEFKCKQELRIRIKVHQRKNSKGFCNLSVTASCKPKNILDLEPSKYSLDDITKLPPILVTS